MSNPVKFECECGKRFEVESPEDEIVYRIGDDDSPVPGKTYLAACPACGSQCGSEDFIENGD